MGRAPDEQNDQEIEGHQIMEEESKVHKPTKRTKRRNTEAKEDELYPGISSQKRVNIRAEQLFNEEQARKTSQQEAAAKKNIHQ
eukprot:4530203-Heterocapsa_arctica.AAC.1